MLYRIHLVIIAVFVAAIFILPLLNYSKVFQVSEAREGVVVNEILESGSLILPLRHGEVVPSKPILFHWIGALSAVVSGKYEEFELRLPSALGGIACIGVIAGFVAGIAGWRIGLSASAILLSMYGFLHLARDGRVDMLFVFFYTIAVLTWLREAIEVRALQKTLSAISGVTYCWLGFWLGLAVLTKGPLGIVAPALVVLSISVFWEGFRGVKALICPGWFIALLIVAPWYVLAASEGSGAFLQRQFLFENITRFLGGSGIPHKPWWFYLVHIWSQAAPWSVLIPMLLCAMILLKNSKVDLKDLIKNVRAELLIQSSAIWFVSVLLFLSISSGKRRAYLLMVLPPLAILLAVSVPVFIWFVSKLCERFPGWLPKCFCKTSQWATVVFGTFLLGITVFVFLLDDPLSFGSSSSKIEQVLELLPSVVLSNATILLPILVLCGVASVVFWHFGYKTKRGELILCSVFLYFQMVFAGFVDTGLAIKSYRYTYKAFAEKVISLVDSSSELFFIKDRMDESFDVFFFYSSRRIKLLGFENPLSTNVFYLVRRENMSRLIIPKACQIREITTGGRIKDEEEKQVVLFVVELKEN